MTLGSSLVASWVKDPALSLLWCRFNPRPGTSECHGLGQKKPWTQETTKKKKKKKKAKPEMTLNYLFLGLQNWNSLLFPWFVCPLIHIFTHSLVRPLSSTSVWSGTVLSARKLKTISWKQWGAIGWFKVAEWHDRISFLESALWPLRRRRIEGEWNWVSS